MQTVKMTVNFTNFIIHPRILFTATRQALKCWEMPIPAEQKKRLSLFTSLKKKNTLAFSMYRNSKILTKTFQVLGILNINHS